MDPFLAPFVQFLMATLQSAWAVPLAVKLLAALLCLSALCAAGVLAAALRHGQQRREDMRADIEEEAAAWRAAQRAPALVRATRPAAGRVRA